MPAAPTGIIKSCVMPAGKNLPSIKEQNSDFHDLFLKKMTRKISWIQIFMIRYEVATYTHTFGS